MMTRRVLALGSFDGVHLAHKAVIDAAVTLSQELCAEVAVFCFSTPPAACLNSDIKLLSTPTQKKALIESLGVKNVIFADYSDFCNIEAEDFIVEFLIKKYSAVGVVCGYNFSFGRGRLGSVSMLSQHFDSQNVRVIPPIELDGEPVSSSRIRSCILFGDVEGASRLLGHSYSVTAPVTSGRRDGRKLGFPTLNQVPHSALAIPKHGVYVTRATFDNGEVYPSVTDVGLAPTLDTSGVVRLETHLLDSTPSQTPKILTVEFLARIRDEQRFSSPDELKDRISLDTAFARSYFDL